mmetsp:Transcript_20672/g.35254  ORF Transcript_20672/g.35254 Transcript_20672/m.35254 type:complete len:128 (-) Transcript_20672:513-896(-)
MGTKWKQGSYQNIEDEEEQVTGNQNGRRRVEMAAISCVSEERSICLNAATKFTTCLLLALLSIIEGVPIHFIIVTMSETQLAFSVYNCFRAICQNVSPPLAIRAFVARRTMDNEFVVYCNRSFLAWS